MVILVAGKAGVGKDTFSRLLKQKLQEQNKKVAILHFADKIKYLCKEFLDWNGEKDEYGRTLLQQFGTEDVRSRLPDFWAEEAGRTIQALQNYFDCFIVSDFRFKNEFWIVDKMLKLPVISVNITRENYISPLTIEQQQHQSEIDLDNFSFDFEINGGNSLEDLAKSMKDFVDGRIEMS